MKGFCEYTIPQVDHGKKIVWLIDQDVGASVTNCAEGVCHTVNEKYPGYRIIYRDTMGNWDELIHENGKFKDYKPARDQGLPS